MHFTGCCACITNHVTNKESSVSNLKWNGTYNLPFYSFEHSDCFLTTGLIHSITYGLCIIYTYTHISDTLLLFQTVQTKVWHVPLHH